MADFVTLSCPSCGGKLEITQDIERFACAHCGQEHIVRRSGSIVSLSPIVDALKKVGSGVDKTAAELAIVRLQKEIGELHTKKIGLVSDSPRPVTSPFLVIALVLGCVLAPLSYLSANSSTFSAVICLSGLLIAIGGIPLFLNRLAPKHWEETIGVQLKSLDQQIATKNVELKHYQDIVSLRK